MFDVRGRIEKNTNVRVLAINFWSPKLLKMIFFTNRNRKHVAESGEFMEHEKISCVAVFAYELPASVDLNLFVMLEKAIRNLIKFPLNFLLVEMKFFSFTIAKSRGIRQHPLSWLWTLTRILVTCDADKNANFHFTQSASMANLIYFDEKAQLLTMKSSWRCERKLVVWKENILIF